MRRFSCICSWKPKTTENHKGPQHLIDWRGSKHKKEWWDIRVYEWHDKGQWKNMCDKVSWRPFTPSPIVMHTRHNTSRPIKSELLSNHVRRDCVRSSVCCNSQNLLTARVEEMEAVLNSEMTVEEKSATLRNNAFSKDGRDNMSVIVISFSNWCNFICILCPVSVNISSCYLIESTC